MKIKAEIELQISEEERKRITISYLEDLIPNLEYEIREEGGTRFWFKKVYDGHGKSVIRYDKFETVTEIDQGIVNLLSLLKK
jgi:hypothetical protein